MLPLVSSAKTHRICWVDFAQAKLSWLGSAATFGFSQAVVISAWTRATLPGQLAPPPGSAITSAMIAMPAAADRDRDRPQMGREATGSATARRARGRG